MDITDFPEKTGSATNDHLQYISMKAIFLKLPKAIELISWIMVKIGFMFGSFVKDNVVRFVQSRRIGEWKQHVPIRQE